MTCTIRRKAALQCMLISTVISSIFLCSFAQTIDKKEQVMLMENLFDNLMEVTGKEYLDKEVLLRQGGADAIAMLQTKLSDKDSFRRFYAKTIINWITGHSPYNQEAISYLDSLPAGLVGTPLQPIPSSVEAAEGLNIYYKSNVTDILAVHLLKLTDLEGWHVMAILLYLEMQKSSDVIDILLRFVSEANADDYIEVALRAIDATNDPLLDTKILQEEKRLKSLNLILPPSLKKRLSKP